MCGISMEPTAMGIDKIQLIAILATKTQGVAIVKTMRGLI